MQINKFKIAIAKSSSSSCVPLRLLLAVSFLPRGAARKPAQSENYSSCTFFHLKITAAHFLLCAVFSTPFAFRTDSYFHCNPNGAANTHADFGAHKHRPIFMQRRSADVKLPNNFNFHETSIIIKFCIIWSNPSQKKRWNRKRIYEHQHTYDVQRCKRCAPYTAQTAEWKIEED